MVSPTNLSLSFCLRLRKTKKNRNLFKHTQALKIYAHLLLLRAYSLSHERLGRSIQKVEAKKKVKRKVGRMEKSRESIIPRRVVSGCLAVRVESQDAPLIVD